MSPALPEKAKNRCCDALRRVRQKPQAVLLVEKAGFENVFWIADFAFLGRKTGPLRTCRTKLIPQLKPANFAAIPAASGNLRDVSEPTQPARFVASLSFLWSLGLLH